MATEFPTSPPRMPSGGYDADRHRTRHARNIESFNGMLTRVSGTCLQQYCRRRDALPLGNLGHEIGHPARLSSVRTSVNPPGEDQAGRRAVPPDLDRVQDPEKTLQYERILFWMGARDVATA